MKIVLAVGCITSGGINNPKTHNPFLCKGKYNEDCGECKNSHGDNPAPGNGVSSEEMLSLLFTTPHSLSTINNLKEKIKKCFIPDCGIVFFLLDKDKDRIREELASLPSLEEKACFVVKLYLVGCSDLVSEDTLHTICNEINRLTFLQKTLVKLLVQKHGAHCGNYAGDKQACINCGFIDRNVSKKQEQSIFNGGIMSTHYVDTPKTEVPFCLNLLI